MSATASKTDLLNEVLDNLASSLGGDVNGSAVVSADGIVYASRFQSSVNVDRVGAIAATTLGVSRRVARDLAMGNTSESIIQCDNGFFLVIPVNERCLLAVSLRKGGNLGMTRLEAEDAGARIAEIMG
jgi:predicted regulator of Ras-like GTPase activity (Roadblock/LC7/MglB family)